MEHKDFKGSFTEIASLESKFSLKGEKNATAKNRLHIMGVDYSNRVFFNEIFNVSGTNVKSFPFATNCAPLGVSFL